MSGDALFVLGVIVGIALAGGALGVYNWRRWQVFDREVTELELRMREQSKGRQPR